MPAARSTCWRRCKALARTPRGEAGRAEARHRCRATGAPWRYAVERVALAGFGIAFTDESMTPALQVGIDDIAIETSGVSEKLDRPLPLKAGLRVASGGGWRWKASWCRPPRRSTCSSSSTTWR
jgi:hypothetical protein